MLLLPMFVVLDVPIASDVDIAIDVVIAAGVFVADVADKRGNCAALCGREGSHRSCECVAL